MIVGTFIKTADATGQHAREAAERGDRILVYRFIEEPSGVRKAVYLPSITKRITAVEDAGWRLDHMSAVGAGVSATGGCVVLCLFRRASGSPT